MEDIFEAVKTNVSMEAVAEYCGLHPKRGLCLCPFHTDSHASFKLYPDHGYCFSCHTRADAVQLVAYRERLTPLQAARRLATQFGIPGEWNPYVATLRTVKKMQADDTKQAIDDMKLSLARMHCTLWQWKLTCAPKNAHAAKKPDPRFQLALHNLEYLDYLMDQCPDDLAEAEQWRKEVKNMPELYALGAQIKKLQEVESRVDNKRKFFWQRKKV